MTTAPVSAKNYGKQLRHSTYNAFNGVDVRPDAKKLVRGFHFESDILKNGSIVVKATPKRFVYGAAELSYEEIFYGLDNHEDARASLVTQMLRELTVRNYYPTDEERRGKTIMKKCLWIDYRSDYVNVVQAAYFKAAQEIKSSRVKLLVAPPGCAPTPVAEGTKPSCIRPSHCLMLIITRAETLRPDLKINEVVENSVVTGASFHQQVNSLKSLLEGDDDLPVRTCVPGQILQFVLNHHKPVDNRPYDHNYRCPNFGRLLALTDDWELQEKFIVESWAPPPSEYASSGPGYFRKMKKEVWKYTVQQVLESMNAVKNGVWPRLYIGMPLIDNIKDPEGPVDIFWYSENPRSNNPNDLKLNERITPVKPMPTPYAKICYKTETKWKKENLKARIIFDVQIQDYVVTRMLLWKIQAWTKGHPQFLTGVSIHDESFHQLYNTMKGYALYLVYDISRCDQSLKTAMLLKICTVLRANFGNEGDLIANLLWQYLRNRQSRKIAIFPGGEQREIKGTMFSGNYETSLFTTLYVIVATWDVLVQLFDMRLETVNKMMGTINKYRSRPPVKQFPHHIHPLVSGDNGHLCLDGRYASDFDLSKFIGLLYSRWKLTVKPENCQITTQLLSTCNPTTGTVQQVSRLQCGKEVMQNDGVTIFHCAMYKTCDGYVYPFRPTADYIQKALVPAKKVTLLKNIVRIMGLLAEVTKENTHAVKALVFLRDLHWSTDMSMSEVKKYLPTEACRKFYWKFMSKMQYRGLRVEYEELANEHLVNRLHKNQEICIALDIFAKW